MKVDVIIPTLCPGREFVSLLERLEEQSAELNRIIVMNTEKEGAPMPWDEPGFFSRHPKVTVKSVKKEGLLNTLNNFAAGLTVMSDNRSRNASAGSISSNET